MITFAALTYVGAKLFAGHCRKCQSERDTYGDGMMRNALVLGLIGLGMLSGCAQSPQTKCQYVLGELRELERKIEESKIAIERGYKIHYSKQPTTYSGTCSTNVPGYMPTYYSCMKNGTTTVENPVAINTQDEKRRLRIYESSYQKLYPKVTRTYNNCVSRKS